MKHGMDYALNPHMNKLVIYKFVLVTINATSVLQQGSVVETNGVVLLVYEICVNGNTG